MTARNLQRGCLALTVLAAVFSGAPLASAEDAGSQVDRSASGLASLSAGDREVLNDLFGRWQAFRSEIATARIHYRSFHNSLDGKKSLADFDALIDGGDLDSSSYGMQRFIESMNGGAYRVNPPWGEGTIVFRDGQMRNDLGPFVTIDDRDVSVFQDSLNNQFDAFTAGGSNRKPDTLETFRPLPPEPWTTESWRVVERDGARVRLSRIIPKAGGGTPGVDPRSIEVERASGVISRVTRLGANGKTLSAARFLEIAELPGGIVFPRIAVEVVLKDDVVTVMHLCVIDRMEINVAIDDGEFHLPAGANSKIVDHRGPRRTVTRLPQDQADVVGWIKTHAPAPAVVARPSAVDHSLRNALLTGNGLLLIAVGLIFLRRQSVGNEA